MIAPSVFFYIIPLRYAAHKLKIAATDPKRI